MKTCKILALLISVLLLAALFTGCTTNGAPGASPGAGPSTDASADPSAGAPGVSETTTPAANDTATPAPANGDPTGDPTAANYEEGANSADSIVNTTSADKVILMVSFGTSYNYSRLVTIGGIESAVAKAYPDYQVRRAFTSQIIIDKLASRDGLRIDNVDQAMQRLVIDGVKDVVVQPTHVMDGIEYNGMVDAVMPFADKFDSLRIGDPILANLTADADFNALAQIAVDMTRQYRAPDTAVVFMGHGTSAASNADYSKLQDVLTAGGYNDYIVGTVEGTPTLDDVVAALKQKGVHNVILRDLMIVAGDHANNDMAGDGPNSWKSILTADGFNVKCIIEGLGQVPAIQQLIITHMNDTMTSTNLSTAAKTTATATAAAAGVTADRIKDGTYSITVNTHDSMFKVVDCQLTVNGNAMSAVMTLSGVGFGGVYMGAGAQASADTAYIKPQLNNGKNSFTVPVTALDRDIDCTGLSAREQKWYDHTIRFESANLPDSAFLPAQVNVTMTGGTGKATVQSPATLTYKDGGDLAEIVWSSPNYTYMIVDGTKYLPVNTSGNSTFMIPVLLDTDMTVTACTVAMSSPHEVDYTLHFDAASVTASK